LAIFSALSVAGINLVGFTAFGPGNLEVAGIFCGDLEGEICGNLRFEGGVGKSGLELTKVVLKVLSGGSLRDCKRSS